MISKDCFITQKIYFNQNHNIKKRKEKNQKKNKKDSDFGKKKRILEK